MHFALFLVLKLLEKTNKNDEFPFPYIAERRHKHRVRSAALYRSPAAPYHQYADMNMTPDHNLYGGYSGHHLYKSVVVGHDNNIPTTHFYGGIPRNPASES